jgi:hypothetical protein
MLPQLSINKKEDRIITINNYEVSEIFEHLIVNQ